MVNRDTFFTNSKAIRTFDLRRIIYLVVAVFFFIVTESGRFIYRPYIYSHQINDYGLADSIGNLGGIIVQIYFMLAVLNSPGKKAFRVIIFVIVGYSIYEILQVFLPRGVFDMKDIYGTLIGGGFCFLLLLLLNRFLKNKILFEFKS